MTNPWIRRLILVATVARLLCCPTTVQADEPQLTLQLQRLMGYGGFAGDIEGAFRLSATGPADLTHVVFLIDETSMADLTAAPFQVQFNTSQFAPGVHTLRAVGTTTSGLELTSNAIRSRFLTPDEARKSTAALILPLLGAILGFTLLSYLITAAVSRHVAGPRRAVRNYGVSGGAICRRCGQPFALHWWTPHLLTARLERCPHCGNWALVRATSVQASRAAESAEDAASSASTVSPACADAEARLRKELDDSRFRDG